MTIPVIIFEQPIGEFAIGVMSAKDILEISSIDRRAFNLKTLSAEGGPQREPSQKRIDDIAEYAHSSDATFPTPILLAIPEEKYELIDGQISFSGKEFASVVDGQHRLLGIKQSGLTGDFNLPVVFILGATEEQKALIFAIVNGKQTKVPASLIYSLFDVVEGQHPFKVAHEIARLLNKNPESPFYRRLKMLGKKTKGSNESLSQGTFVRELIKHISDNPYRDLELVRQEKEVPVSGTIFSQYFISGQDEVILKIIQNLFSAAKVVFKEEWEDASSYILSKTTGFVGIMQALPRMVKHGEKLNDLSFQYFQAVFLKLKEQLQVNKERLTSPTPFASGSQGESKLKQYLELITDGITTDDIKGII